MLFQPRGALVLKASNSAKHLSICLAPGLARQAHARVLLT